MTIDAAVNSTRALLEKAREDNARMLYFSSSEIYGDQHPENVPTSEDYRGNVSCRGPRACYDESKRLGETLCWVYEKYFQVFVSVVRPFNIFGSGMMPKDYRVVPNFTSSLLSGKPLQVYGNGMQTRTFFQTPKQQETPTSTAQVVENFVQALTIASGSDSSNTFYKTLRFQDARQLP